MTRDSREDLKPLPPSWLRGRAKGLIGRLGDAGCLIDERMYEHIVRFTEETYMMDRPQPQPGNEERARRACAEIQKQEWDRIGGHAHPAAHAEYCYCKIILSEFADAPVSARARQRIEAERHRQIESEGWTPAHDDTHDGGELLSAAMCYWRHAIGWPFSDAADGAPVGWPWDAKWWKPKSAERDLERAGALCLAEIDRLNRELKSVSHVNHRLSNIVSALDAISDASAPAPFRLALDEEPSSAERERAFEEAIEIAKAYSGGEHDHSGGFISCRFPCPKGQREMARDEIIERIRARAKEGEK